MYLKSEDFFRDPRGICYGDGDVYVADYGQGQVWYFPDNDNEDVDPKLFLQLTNAYALSCINA